MSRPPIPGGVPGLRTLIAALLLGATWGGGAWGFLGLRLGDRELFFLEPVIAEQEGEVDAHLDARAPEIELGELAGSTLGAAYGISLLGAGEGLTARWDRYQLRGRLSPGPMRLLGGPIKLGFALDAGSEFRFVRHFRSKAEAAAARPLEPWVIGSVDSILSRMRPGDLASMPVRAELLLQAAFEAPIAGIPVRPSLFVKLGGTFQASVLRLRDDRVRVRLLSSRTRTAGAALKAGFLWDAELIEVLGESVRVFSELSVAKATWSRQRGQAMLFDATLDLSDPEARAAFEWLFYRPVRFARGDETVLSAGWSLIQQLAAVDEEQGRETRRVELHHSGLLDFRQSGWNLKLGNSLLFFGRRNLNTLLDFEPVAPDEPPIVLASSLSAGKSSVWFGRREEKWLFESQVYAVREPGRLHTALWSLRYRVKDRRFTASDRENLAEKLRFRLGGAGALELPDEGEEKPRIKGEIQVRLARPALEELAGKGRTALASGLAAWVGALRLDPMWRDAFRGDLARLPGELEALLRPALSGEDPEALLRLARLRVGNAAFHEIGTGWLVSMLSPRVDDDRLSIRAVYKSSASGKHKLAIGDLAAAPSESVLPVLRFLETGVTELQDEAALEASEVLAPAPGAPAFVELPSDQTGGGTGSGLVSEVRTWSRQASPTKR